MVRGWQTRAARSQRPGTIVLATLLLLAVLPGCTSAAAGRPAAGGTSGTKLSIMTRSLSGVGTVLVTGDGYALYMFAPDNHRSVTCAGVCAGTWPPLMLPSGAMLAPGRGVRSSLLSTDPDPGGGRVVTYDGWPLYTYTGDVQPGQATGQGIDLNGGDWYVLRSSGAPVVSVP